MICNDVEERLAWGQELSQDQQVHISGCPSCTRVATSFCMLDDALGTLERRVPEGFADRVMTQIYLPVQPAKWLERRWVQVAFVYGGFGVAIFNLVRFVAGILVASVGLGTTP